MPTQTNQPAGQQAGQPFSTRSGPAAAEQVPYPIEPDAEGRENAERAGDVPLAARTRYLVHPNEGSTPSQWETTKQQMPLNQPTLRSGNEEMADVAVIGADRNATVTPANPTPPTNIPSGGETPPNTPELVDPAVHAVRDFEGNEKPLDDPRTQRLLEVETQEYQDPVKFAPQTAGMPHEAAGTELAETTTDEPSVEGEEPVERVISVSAGHEPYVIRPNVTHPSNAVNYEEPILPPPTQPVDPPPEPPPLDLETLQPASAPVGDGTTQMYLKVIGTGFTPECRIVADDVELGTTRLSMTELETYVLPVPAAPATVSIEVERGEETSDILTFEFTAVAADDEEQAQRSTRKPERKPKRQEPRKGKGKRR